MRLVKDQKETENPLLDDRRLRDKYVGRYEVLDQTKTLLLLPDDETAVKMKASIAKFNALAGKDVSTDGMLAMIANTYRQKNFGSPLQFKKDFQKKHPAEFVNNTEKNILLTARNRGTVND